MGTADELIPILKKLRLSGILSTLDIRVRQAVEDNMAHTEFLYRLLADEIERREARQLQLRLRRAKFEGEKTLEDFDFIFNPLVPKSRIIDLATCHFVDRREVICLLGPAGVGKSHLAQAFGHRACMKGHTVLFVTAQQVFNQLRAARADQSYERKLARFTTPDLLIIDDLGLRPLRYDEPEDFFEIIRQRYEKRAMIVTSNRAIEEWPAMFNNPLLASTAMDRLLHHAHVIVLEGDSFRNPPGARRDHAGRAAKDQDQP